MAQLVDQKGAYRVLKWLKLSGLDIGLHCSSFLGLPYRILIIYLVKPKKGTTMETIGRLWECAAVVFVGLKGLESRDRGGAVIVRIGFGV